MSKIYVPKHFSIQEFIPPSIYALCGDDAIRMYHPNILEGADMLREHYGLMICNTVHSPRLMRNYGSFSNRGLRPVVSGVGVSKSLHKLGVRDVSKEWYSAIDLDPIDNTVQFIHDDIKKNQTFWLKYFTRIESHQPDGRPINWIHADNLSTGLNEIKFFKP